jgi:S-adenosyl-L-methionine hydrolase (adenosine-forming)
MTSDRPAPVVALLTDFGLSDGYVGVVKAVILGLAPGQPLLDLTHDVPPQDVRHGAWLLHTTWRYLPEGSVCLAVVDPGVGTPRRPVAFAAGGRIFVGPDNGLFSYVLHGAEVTAAVVLDLPQYHLTPVSATFHGRDIFAPVCGHLAAGAPLSSVGSPLDPATLITFDAPRPEQRADGLLGHVLHVDHFGNLITNFDGSLAVRMLDDPAVRVRVGVAEISARAATFAGGPPDAPFLIQESSGHLAIAVRDGSAAARLGAGVGSDVLVLGARLSP